jgi:hypothetical protein
MDLQTIATCNSCARARKSRPLFLPLGQSFEASYHTKCCVVNVLALDSDEQFRYASSYPKILSSVPIGFWISFFEVQDFENRSSKLNTPKRTH